MRFPDFYNPSRVGERYSPNLVLAEQEGLGTDLKPASSDRPRRLLVPIDCENDFVNGTLPVPGGAEAIKKIVELIFTYPEQISKILLPMDKHLVAHIFYGLWWKDQKGKHPAPYTQILNKEVQEGVWTPILKPEWSKFYTARLEETGQAPLMIWPKHCSASSEGSNLIPSLAEAVEWFCAARKTNPVYLFKGMIPESEHYGMFASCIQVPGYKESRLLVDMLELIAGEYEEIFITGLAEDFCVRESLKQMIDFFQKNMPEAVRRIRLVRDCTALVFPEQRKEADEFLARLEEHGIQVVSSDNPFLV